MGEQINGNRTMSINDVIKLVVFVVTLCGYGYAQQLRMDRLENTVANQSLVISALGIKMDTRFEQQQNDIEAWKRATVDAVFKRRGNP